MLRELDFNEISDGKFYQSQDMVRADCGGCKGCSSCCRGMGSSIVLDPLDVHRIASDLGKSFDELLASHLDLQVVDGIILPNLKMTGPGEACTFLNDQGRCSTHPLRPGICRICPHWDGITTGQDSSIFYRSTNVQSQINPRSRSANGSILRTSDAMRLTFPTGIII